MTYHQTMRQLQDLKRQNSSLAEEYQVCFEEFVKSGRYVSGAGVESFEENFARYTGSKHCVALANGTVALEVALRALQVDPETLCAVPAMTFVASVNAVSNAGGTALLVDVEKNSRLVGVENFKSFGGKVPKVLIPVHLHGKIAPMEEILKLARLNSQLIVEDAAQAAGSFLNGKHAGTFGDVGAFSFYPGKNLGALGEAGCLITDRDDVAEFARLFRNWGAQKRYEHDFPGSNMRMDELQGLLLDIKLRYLDSFISQRRNVAGWYHEALDDPRIGLPEISPDHSVHVYGITIDNREIVQGALKDAGYETGIHYPRAIHQNAAYESTMRVSNLEVSEKLAQSLLSLPMDEFMTEKEVEEIAMIVKRSLA